MSVFSVAISFDNKFIISGCLDNTIRIWDIFSGLLQKDLFGH